jgi:hypothetical protein
MQVHETLAGRGSDRELGVGSAQAERSERLAV